MHLALPRPSVRWKRHESVMNSVRGRGSAMSANVRAMKGALMPVRLHRSNSLRIAWDERPDDLRRAALTLLVGCDHGVLLVRWIRVLHRNQVGRFGRGFRLATSF